MDALTGLGLLAIALACYGASMGIAWTTEQIVLAIYRLFNK